MKLNLLAKALEVVPNTVKEVKGIFKATDKGLLSSKRTISGIMVAFGVTYITQNMGPHWVGLVIMGLGVAVAIATIWEKKDPAE